MVKSTPVFHVKHPCVPVEPTRRGAPSMRPMPRGKRPVQAERETSGRRRRRGSAPPACRRRAAESDYPSEARSEEERVAEGMGSGQSLRRGLSGRERGRPEERMGAWPAAPPRRRTATPPPQEDDWLVRIGWPSSSAPRAIARCPRERTGALAPRVPRSPHRHGRPPDEHRHAQCEHAQSGGTAKRRRRTRCSTRKPDREAPAHECFT